MMSCFAQFDVDGHQSYDSIFNNAALFQDGDNNNNMTTDDNSTLTMTEQLNFLKLMIPAGNDSHVSEGTQALGDDSALKHGITFVKSVIVPIICIFGMLGNALSLLILTRKKLKSSCDGTERTVNLGLFSLSISDFLFCVCLLPHGILQSDSFDSDKKDFTLIYRTYGSSLINTFILTSTWCTVNMAASRYIAIVRPIRTRSIVSITGTKISTFLVFFICIAFNIPRFFEYKIEEIVCPNGDKIYFMNSGYLRQHDNLRLAYKWVYFVIGIFLPLATLAFCNICLVRTLINSSKLRRRCRVPVNHVTSNIRITSILVTIVVMYIVLVSPAEILRFSLERLVDKASAAPHALVMAVEFTNVLQTLNFTCNFMLYFILNVHFRIAMREMFCCACLTRFNKDGGHRFRPISSNQKSDVSKLVETSQTKV